MSTTERRWNAWGFEGESLPVSVRLREWLKERIGTWNLLAAVSESTVRIPPARALPRLPVDMRGDAASRLRHACGHSFPDLLALRSGTVAAFPDAVAFPASAEEVVALLRAAVAARVSLVVRGGGTSVVGGVTMAPSARPVVVLSLDRLAGLVSLDGTSGLATFRAGTMGPAVEAALATHGLRLGHEPQSFELSTVGGWVATRSAGQRSSGVGKIEDLVAGLEVATARGLWRLPPQPASAAGPELRRVLLGSEGRCGVITEATLRVRPLPAAEDGATVLLPSWEQGIACCRELARAGGPLEVMRLSDANETGFASALIGLSPLVGRLTRVVVRAKEDGPCALLLGWAGTVVEVRRAHGDAASIWRAQGGRSVGRSGWKRWRKDRFRHPYLRDALLDAGWGVDTLETAAAWAWLPSLYRAVGDAMRGAAAGLGFPVEVLCHVSHAYADGASLYFTFLWPLRRGAEVTAWQAMKDAACRAILASHGTITHHHGVGRMHAPYLEAEVGAQGVAMLRAAVAAADPDGVLNPGVLLPGEAP